MATEIDLNLKLPNFKLEDLTKNLEGVFNTLIEHLNLVNKSIQKLSSEIKTAINTNNGESKSSVGKELTKEQKISNSILNSMNIRSTKFEKYIKKTNFQSRNLFGEMSKSLGGISKGLGTSGAIIGALIGIGVAITKLSSAGSAQLSNALLTSKTLLGNEDYNRLKGIERAFNVYGVNEEQTKSILQNWQNIIGQQERYGNLPANIAKGLQTLAPDLLNLRGRKPEDVVEELINRVSKLNPAKQTFYAGQFGLPLPLVQANGLSSLIREYTNSINNQSAEKSLEINKAMAELKNNLLNLQNSVLKGVQVIGLPLIKGASSVIKFINNPLTSILDVKKNFLSYDKEKIPQGAVPLRERNFTPPSTFNININTSHLDLNNSEEIGNRIARSIHGTIEAGESR